MEGLGLSHIDRERRAAGHSRVQFGNAQSAHVRSNGTRLRCLDRRHGNALAFAQVGNGRERKALIAYGPMLAGELPAIAGV